MAANRRTPIRVGVEPPEGANVVADIILKYTLLRPRLERSFMAEDDPDFDNTAMMQEWNVSLGI